MLYKNSRLTLNNFLAFLNNHLIDYPTPINLNYFWSFGSLSGLALTIQIVTGVFLAMHYTPHIDYAFISVEHIMRDVNNGWLIRYMHANGASLFFIVVYCHIFRGLYYASYMKPRQHVWSAGVTIFLLMMATAFMGYVLPWGQMSFWGATVITNLFSAIPLIGNSIVLLLWGGFSVDNATLNRFFSLHYLLPFLIVALVLIHLAALHHVGSSNPLGVEMDNVDKIPFYPYFFLKDLFAFLVYLIVFVYLVCFNPNLLGHPDNYIPANPLVTPAHIVPEWYFLPFYAILRSIPNKLGGVLAMIGAILILYTLPFSNPTKIRSGIFRPTYQLFFWILFFDFLFLGWIGQKPVKEIFVLLGQFGTLVYFSFFFLNVILFYLIIIYYFLNNIFYILL